MITNGSPTDRRAYGFRHENKASTQITPSGGAEHQVVLLARGLAGLGHEVTIASFYEQGELLNEARGSDVDYVSLDKKSR